MELDARRLKLKEERLDAVDGNGRGQELLTLPKFRVNRRFRRMAQVEPRAVPEHLAIERRLAIHERDRKSELTRIKSAATYNIGHEKLWLGLKQRWLGQFFDVCVSQG